MIYFLLTGLALGLNAGLSPGPLTTLILTESLRGGWPAGFRVALAPLLSDSFTIGITLLLIAPLPAWGLSAITLFGGAFMVWLGWGTIRSPGKEAVATTEATAAAGTEGLLLKGFVTNLLNPQPHIFWITMGTPMLKQSFAGLGWAGPAAFAVPFFTLLVGCKLGIAYAVGRGRHLLQGRAYRLALQIAGLALVLLGTWRVWDGIQAFR